MSSQKIYLITGANRGLGRGLTEALLTRPNTTIIAGVRDTSSSTSKSLTTLPAASGSKVIPVVIDSNSDTSALEATKTLQADFGISHLDVVIANAGISQNYSPAAEVPLSEVRSHFEVNTIGALLLFQATWPLLQKSEKPIFVGLSTGLASIGDMGNLPIPATAYGISKVALNYLVRKIHFENKGLVAFVVSPGWVQTDMGNLGATSNGMKEAPVTIKDSISGMLAKIDSATRENISGTFQSFDETEFKW